MLTLVRCTQRIMNHNILPRVKEYAFLEVQYQVLLEARPPHQPKDRAQRLARLRARLAELEREPQTFRLANQARPD